MNIPEEMKCHCRNKFISPAEAELARRFYLDPHDVHRFMDEWNEAARHIANNARERESSRKADILKRNRDNPQERGIK